MHVVYDKTLAQAHKRQRKGSRHPWAFYQWLRCGCLMVLAQSPRQASDVCTLSHIYTPYRPCTTGHVMNDPTAVLLSKFVATDHFDSKFEMEECEDLESRGGATRVATHDRLSAIPVGNSCSCVATKGARSASRRC